MKARTKAEAKTQSEKLVNDWAMGAALAGWIPGSALIFTGADMIMIRQVAEKFDIASFDEEALRAHLGGIVASAVGGAVASELGGLIPVVGWIAKSAAMSGKAKLIGAAVIDYFERLSPLPAA